MTTVCVVTQVHAPPERCFDLARSADVHAESTAQTHERIVAGKMSGLLEAGDTITFEARHFGIRQQFTAVITEMDRPTRFHDKMLRGAFRFFEHEHVFEPTNFGTTMTDLIVFAAPGGWAGLIVERSVLKPYLRHFLKARAAYIREIAEKP